MTYRTADLLRKYGTSLEDTKKLIGELPGAFDQYAKENPEKRLLTAKEAKALYGIDLPAGSTLKLTPKIGGLTYAKKGEDGDTILNPDEQTGGYDFSYLTPDGWEVMPDDTFISPDGKRYTREQLAAMDTEAESQFYSLQDDYFHYNAVGAPDSGVPGESELSKALNAPLYEVPFTDADIDILNQQQQAERERIKKALGAVYSPEFYGEDVTGLLQQIDANPDKFLDEIQGIGRTPDTENLLKTLFSDITDEQLNELFATPEMVEIQDTVAYLDQIFTLGNVRAGNLDPNLAASINDMMLKQGMKSTTTSVIAAWSLITPEQKQQIVKALLESSKEKPLTIPEQYAEADARRKANLGSSYKYVDPRLQSRPLNENSMQFGKALIKPIANDMLRAIELGDNPKEVIAAPLRAITEQRARDWRPPTDEEKKRGIYAYQPIDESLTAYERWNDPSFNVPLPKNEVLKTIATMVAGMTVGATPTEDNKLRFGVKGAMELAVELAFFPMGGGAARGASAIGKLGVQSSTLLAKLEQQMAKGIRPKLTAGQIKLLQLAESTEARLSEAMSKGNLKQTVAAIEAEMSKSTQIKNLLKSMRATGEEAEGKTPEGKLPQKPIVPKEPIKEPWMMTKEEYLVKYLPKKESQSQSFNIKTRNQIQNTHAYEVKKAITSGKPVPESVLKDYPDLYEIGKKKYFEARKQASKEAGQYYPEFWDEGNKTIPIGKSTSTPTPEGIKTPDITPTSKSSGIKVETGKTIPTEGIKPPVSEGKVPPAEPPKEPPKTPVQKMATPSEPSPPVKVTLSENVIGLRDIEPGLIRSETIGNVLKDTLNNPLEKLGANPLVKADPMANAAMRERARVRISIESNANVIGTEAEQAINKVFKIDKQGRIPALSGIDSTISGAPTIQDVAARLPIYKSKLTGEQLAVLKKLESQISPYKKLLNELGVEIPSRGDVMEGGFYLPRGRAGLEGADEPFKVSGARRGTKKGFERPATFSSMSEGIDKGYEYKPIGQSLTAHATDAGIKAADIHVVKYFKALTDETGKLIGETHKKRLLRQNPEIAGKVAAINAQLDRLKSNRASLTDRQMDVIDLWQNDPSFDDLNVLLDGLETMRAGSKPPRIMAEINSQIDNAMKDLKALRPEYKLAQRRAMDIPRDQSVINLPALQGITYPNEIANAANVILNKEGKTTGALSSVVNVANAFNNLYRGLRATLDDSALGIQGLLGIGGAPKAYAEALKVNIQAWFKNGDKILGKFMNDFDFKAGKTGRLTASGWAKSGLHLGGATSEFQLGNIGSKLSELPIIKQSNRAFGYFGDALRLTWADNELAMQLGKGKTLAQIRASGDLDRIANGANVMTGWAKNKAFGSAGDLLLFAPRFLQSRLETVVMGARGLLPGATLDQRMARTSLLKFIGWGTMATVGINYLLGNDTDFRPMVDGKRNGKFMRIKYGDNYYSLFGTWDSLLGAIINVGTGRPLNALRNMGSGITALGWDLITNRDYDYQPVRDTPEDLAKWIMNSVTPFSLGQMPEGIKQTVTGIQDKDTGAAIAGAVNIASEIFGVKSYPTEDWKTNKTRLGLSLYDNPALYSDENPIYSTKLYWSDTLSKLGNKNLNEVIGNKDYPPDVQSIAQGKIILDTLAEIPSRKLTDLNTDPSNGDTWKELYQQGLRRQEIIKSGDEAALKEFDADKRYKNAKLGYMTQREYALLTQFNEIVDKGRKAQFLKEHPELELNPREEYLKSHPDENARLAIYGQAKVLTQKAYDKALALIKELDIPDSAVMDFLPPKEFAKPYFDYQDIIGKFGANSAEARIIGIKNPKLFEWIGREAVDDNLQALELQAKNRDLQEQYDSFSEEGDNYLPSIPDKTSPDYKKGREYARTQLKEKNPQFADDLLKIDAYKAGATEDIVKKHLDFHHEENEAKKLLYYLKNNDYYRFAYENGFTTNDGGLPDGDPLLNVKGRNSEKWNIPVITIKAQDAFIKADEEYKALTDDESRAQFRLDNPDWVDDMNRIEAYNHGADAEMAEFWAEHGRKAGEKPGYDAEEKLWLVDNPNVFKWALDNELLTDDGKDWNIPVLRINAKYREQDSQYDAIQNDDERVQKQLRKEYLQANPDYDIARHDRDAYQLGLAEDMVDNWAEYNQLPDYGKWKDRYRKEHPDFDNAVKTQQKAKGQSPWADIEADKIPAVQYDQIYEQFKRQFDAYDNVQGTPTERDAARKLIFQTDPTFKAAYYKRQAYGELFPEQYIQNYADYYQIPAIGYEQERYLKEHPEFYKVMKAKKGWKDTIKFDEIPTEAVEKLYGIYRTTPKEGKQREAYRKEHPDLDDWLVNHAPASIRVLPLDHVHKKTTTTEFIEKMESDYQEAQDAMRRAGLK